MSEGHHRHGGGRLNLRRSFRRMLGRRGMKFKLSFVDDDDFDDDTTGIFV